MIIIKLALIPQGQAQALQKLNNTVYFWLNSFRPHVTADKWRHDISQNWEFLVINFKNISDALMDHTDLSKPDPHISGLGYLEEGISHFTKVITEDKV